MVRKIHPTKVWCTVDEPSQVVPSKQNYTTRWLLYRTRPNEIRGLPLWTIVETSDKLRSTPALKKKYALPIQSGTILSTRDCSSTYFDVLALQEEFGFDYATAVGSLIYLMNTFIKLNFVIRKLARFMQYPGRQHFKILDKTLPRSSRDYTLAQQHKDTNL